MVRNSPLTGGDVTPGEIAALRRAAGYALLGAAVLVWGIAIMMSPHGDGAGNNGVDHVKASVAVFARNASLGTLVLVMLAAAALFWRRRPERRAPDLVPLGLMAVLAVSSFYQLAWIETDVLDVDQAQAASEPDGT